MEQILGIKPKKGFIFFFVFLIRFNLFILTDIENEKTKHFLLQLRYIAYLMSVDINDIVSEK